MSHLIVGLGNPGEKYNETRHNVGFEILDALVSKYEVKLQKKNKLLGAVGTTNIDEKQIIFLKPTTYMNLSGKAIRKCVDYYKVSIENILVVVDDIDVPLGEIRLRFCGSAGTHNGLKSIEQELNSRSYPRLRIGIGTDKINNLEDFVLEKFLPSEKEIIKSVVDKALNTVEILLEEGINKAMNFANIRMKKKLGESQ